MQRAVRSVDSWLGAGLAVVGAVYIQQSLEITTGMLMSDMLGPRAFPFALGASLVVVGAAIALRPLVRTIPAADVGSARTLAALVAASIVYILVFNPLGYIVSTASFLAFLAYYIGERRHWLTASLSIGVALALYTGFGQLLHVPLPKGILGF